MSVLKTLDFSIQQVLTLPKTKEYVALQAGKGKEENSIIQVNSIGFSYIEGLIWDKNREYGSKLKSKISSSDWSRILVGFQASIEKLKTYKEEDKIKEILKFEVISSQNSLDNITENIDDIEQLLTEITVWISKMIGIESYISILKNKK